MRLFQENLFLIRGGILSKIARAWPTPPPATAQRETSFPTSRAPVCILPLTTKTACTFFSSSSDEHLSKRDSIKVSEEETLVAGVVAVLTEQKNRGRWGFLRAMLGTFKITSQQAAKITIRLRNNPRLALRFFRWSEASSLCRHDISSYAAMVHVLARGRLRSQTISLIRSAIILVSNDRNEDVDEAVNEVFRALVDSYRACDSTPLTFDLLIRACLQSKRFDQAIQIVRGLRSRSFLPSVTTCNDLVREISVSRGTDAGISIYEELFDVQSSCGRISPNLQTFNEVLVALGREAKHEDLEKIRGEMEERGCKPNFFTYSVLMRSLCDDGRLAAAQDLFAEMKAEGIAAGATAYDAMIGGLCAGGEMARAEEFLREMIMEGIEPTSTSYERLIVGLCVKGDVSNAVYLFEEMVSRGLRPESSMVGKLVGKLCEKRRVVESLKLLRREMERGEGSFFPSREMFKALIEGFCAEGKIEEALELQAEMAGRGFEPDLEICQAFVDGFRSRGDNRRAGKLIDEMLGQGFVPLGCEEDG